MYYGYFSNFARRKCNVVPVPRVVEFKMATGCKFLSLAASSRKCYLHIVDDAKSDIKPLTSKRLKTLVDRIKDWKGLYGKQHDIALILESNGLVEFVDENIDQGPVVSKAFTLNGG